MQQKKFRVEIFNNLDENLKEKISKLSLNRLYITEELLKKHLTENEVLELIKKGILKDDFYE